MESSVSKILQTYRNTHTCYNSCTMQILLISLLVSVALFIGTAVSSSENSATISTPVENIQTTDTAPNSPTKSQEVDYNNRYTPTNDGNNNSYEQSPSEDKSLKYNYMEDKYEYVGEDESLKYNYMEDKYEYVGEDESLKYNYMDDKYEYVGEDESLKYNYMDDEWGYE